MLIFKRRHKLDHNWWSFDQKTENHRILEQTESEETKLRYETLKIIRVTGKFQKMVNI